MKTWLRSVGIFLVAASSVIWPSAASAQQCQIDTQRSVITIFVDKSGLFSRLAHDHEIAAPISSGCVNASEHPSVQLLMDARSLRVRDPDTSDKERNEIQERMLGPDVLDSQRYREIAFQSSAVEAEGPGHWTVHGQLTLHGMTRPVTVDVVEDAKHYSGRTTLKQTDFGMKPVKVAGGAVTVKDEVRIEFDIWP